MRRVLVAIMVLALFIASCTPQIEENPVEISENQLSVYLANGARDDLVAYCIDLTSTNVNKQISQVLYTLKEGSVEDELLPTLPGDLVIEKVELNEGNVILHVNKVIYDMDQIEFLLARTSLIRSLTSIENIISMEFYVDGLPMKDANGKVYGSFTKEDAIVQETIENEELRKEDIVLYFPDANGESLIRVNREITISANESMEKRIIEELMILPQSDLVTSMIPEETMIKSIYIDEGVCYVDFNEAFKTKHLGGSTSEVMTVYSIVNSLTELPSINKVQFFIEGKKTENFKGHLEFDSLFEQDIDLVNKDVQLEDNLIETP